MEELLTGLKKIYTVENTIVCIEVRGITVVRHNVIYSVASPLFGLDAVFEKKYL